MKTKPARPVLEEFEPRILYSADFAPAALAGSSLPGASEQRLLQAQETPAASPATIEIAFVDVSLPDAQSLIDDLQAQRDAGRPIEIVRIEGGDDGITRISETLADRTDVSAVHVLSHGSDGVLQLGSARLDAATLLARAGEMAQWGASLSANADLLLYGCNVTATAQGREFINSLAALTGADVAASDDATGSAARGGDWLLEQRTGAIEAVSVADASLQQTWAGLLGNQFQVNTTTNNDQTTAALNRGSQQAVAYDAAGNFVVVWTSKAQDQGVTDGVYARRFAADGTALTAEILVNSTTAGNQNQARVVSDAAGNFVVTWTSDGQDGNLTGVYVRRFSSAGTALTAEIAVNTTTTGAQTNSVIGMNQSTGAFVVAWEGNGVGDTAGIFFRRFSANGTALDATEQRANLTDSGTEQNAAVAMDSSGKFVVAFDVGNHMYFQRFDAAGAAQGSRTQVDNVLSNSTGAAIAMDSAGNFTLVYREQSILTGIWGHGYFADGTQRYTWFQPATGDATSASIAMAGDGAFIVSYEKTGVAATDIYARLYNSNGSANGNEFIVNQTTTGSQTACSVALLDIGHYVVAWTGEGPGDIKGVIARTFGAANTAPVIGSNGGGASAAVSVAENGTAVATVSATDTDLPAQTLTYSISGGADAARFAINASTGVLTFAAAPNFEAPTDAGANNVYDVIVQVSDGLLTDTQAIAVTITNVNEAPAITSNGGGASASVSTGENQTAVTPVTSTDVDAASTLTYSVSGGADAVKFAINASTGVLTFVAAPNFEAPTDAGGNNVYDVIVRVTDGTLADTQAIAVTVTNVNEAPVITSNGAGASASVNAAENQSVVTTVASSDVDAASTLTYSISGGADAAKFAINASTGVLSFVAAPNFEAPTDAGGNNVYDVIVQVSDGALADTQAIAVTITNVNEAPAITSDGGAASASLSRGENQTAVTTVTAADADAASTLTYSISGGADAARFAINASTGVLTFVAAPNFEAPTDAGANNVYNVTVRVTDGTFADTQAITVTVTNVNEAPAITSNGAGASASLNAAENQTAVATVTATDVDAASTLTYSISGGADAARFAINASTGVLTFVATPNFEAPNDAGANNVYDVIVQASDGALADTQAIAVTVTNVNEAPAITSDGGAASASLSKAENQTAVTTVTASDVDAASTLTYSISGGADAAKFSINASTGVLSFVTAPNFEAPSDAGANNVYDVIVRVTDGTFADTQAIAVTITNVNEAPTITSDGAGASASLNAAENQTAVTTVTSTDVDAASTLTYSISGGADAAMFAINTSTGELTFVAAPNFEAPSDAGANNVYNVTVRVTDGTLADTQAIAVTVTNVNEAPTITSNGGGASTSISIAENTTAVATVAASDPDGTAITYSLAGGADAARFSINASTGALRFASAPDYETPLDAGANNVYDVIVQASDGTLTDTQAIAVTVTDVGGALVVTTTADVLDGDVSSIEALFANRGADGLISLREAISAANNTTAADTIVLPSGNYALTLSGGEEDNNVRGDLDVRDNLVITGASASSTTVSAGGLSGVFEVVSGTLTMSGVTIRDGASNNGAGVLVDNGATLALSQSVVRNNAATQGGGGVGLLTSGATITLDGVQVLNNTAQYGGGVYIFEGSLVATDTTVDGNTTTKWAGGIYIEKGTGVLNRVTSSNNNAGLEGGGIMLEGNAATLSVTNATVSGNTSAVAGGGIYVWSGALTVNASTIANNNALSGAGVYLRAGGSASLANTIVAFNTGGNANTALTSLGHNIDSGSSLGLSQVGDVSNTDPLLAALANNGGLTFTHALLAGSQAINAGDSAAAPTMDQRGAARVGAADIGAYEYAGGVNAAPVLAGVNNLDTIAEDSLTDNGTLVSALIAGHVSDADAGALAGIAVTAVDNSNGSWQYSLDGGSNWAAFGAPSSTSARLLEADALTRVRFVPIADWNGTVSAGLSLRAWDRTSGSAGGTANTSVTGGSSAFSIGLASSSITVRAVNDAPVITSDGGGASAAVNVAENGTAVTTVTASDIDAGTTLTYSIVGGADAGKFTIDTATGVLGFLVAPDFEAPGDAGANNVYDVTVEVSDGSLSSTQAIAVSVTNANEAPAITSNGGAANASLTVAENQTAVTTVTASDADAGSTLSYTISGGADAARFSINASTGVLTFTTAPDFEAPTDAGANNVYDVTVQVSDGALSATQAIAVSVTNVNEAPVITSNGGGASASVTVAEGGTAVTTVVASDVDAASSLSYSISGGADAARFSINASTGVLTFNAAPNFEAPTDAGADNVYDVTVQVSDGSLSSTQAIVVSVSNVNEAPLITSNGGGASASVSAAENQTAVTTVTASDIDAASTLSYSISGGADAAMFSINATTGVLTFNTAPDFEVPGDASANNVYDVAVEVSDGSLSSTQAIAVSVTNTNEAPAITSNGGAANASLTVAENQTAVTTVTASDADAASTLSYSISGGADAARLSINAATGVLSFNTAPDFESPGDAGADNVYDVIVQVSDGALSAAQAIAVSVTNANEAPVITSDGGGASASVNVAEGGTAVTTVVAADVDAASSLSYSISGGADAAMFSINASTGVLTFNTAPDFEAPGDAGANNVYDVTVQVSDGALSATQAIAVSVSNVNEAPAITSDGGGASASVSAAENQTAVTTVTASDIDAGSTLSYSISGGADAARFSIDAVTGVLTFNTAPDFEVPGDAGSNNVYDVTVEVSDGSLSSTQAIAVSVTNANEAPAITSNGGAANASLTVAENQAAVTTVTASDADAASTLSYSISGGADAARFSINATTGVLSFNTAPDFEAPTDVGADNVYDVTVQVSDGSLTDTQLISVSVANANEAPFITSDGGGASASVNVAEGGTPVTTVVAGDADAASSLSYSISGGADAARFSINASTGVLTFNTAPDFEAPGDAGADNVYDVTVQVSDGSLSSTQAIAVSVSNVNEAPVITSDGGGPSASVSAAENQTAVTTVTASDVDAGSTLSYSISGGADAARFSIDASTGVLTFNTAPDFEAPNDVGSNNVYDVTVQVSDGSLTDTQTIAVSITPANDGAPVITSNGGGANAAVSVAENNTVVTTVSATDSDLPAQALNFSITGGADAARFTIDAASGALSFVAAPDFEAPVDANGDNVYDVIVQVSDGGLTDKQFIAVTVTAVNETAPVITSDGGGATAVLGRAENATAVTNVTATDADALDVLRFAITGGADAGRFTIDAVSGALSFVAAPDVEAPADANADNRYEVTVSVSDGALSAQQSLFIDVGNVDEAPKIVTNLLLLSKDGATIVLLGTDPDTAASALNYQASGQAGGRFELVAAPGVAVTGFSQAQVDAGAVRFVADASGAGPTYVLNLSDGVSTVTSGGPRVVIQASAPDGVPLPTPLVPAPDPAPPAVPTAAPTAAVATAANPAATALSAPGLSSESAVTLAQALLSVRGDDKFEPGPANANRSVVTEPAATTATRDSTVTAVATLAQFALLSESSDSTGTSGAPTIDLASALRDRLLGEQLDQQRDSAESSQRSAKDVQAASAALTTGLSVGYVLWLARGGVLVASLMSALPAWAMVDPLPVLAQMKRRDGQADDGAGDDDADDPLEKLFSKARQVVARGTSALTPSTPTETAVAQAGPAADINSLEQPA